MTADPILITGVGKRAGFHVARAFLHRRKPVIGTYRTRYPRLEELERLAADLYHCDFDRKDEFYLVISDIKARHVRMRGIIHIASQWH